MGNRIGRPPRNEEIEMIQIIPVKESYGTDFYVYRGDTLVRVCPSIGMAREVAAGL
jgi:hypothetical protein